MKDAQKPDHKSLNMLVNYLRDGRYVIPDFQREFEWKPWDIRELMRSIFLDYYIGSLLLWKGKEDNFDALSASQSTAMKATESRNTLSLMASNVLRRFTTHSLPQICRSQSVEPLLLFHPC